MMYRGREGMISWLLHRLTGLGILLFLLVHIVDIMLIGYGPKLYNEAVDLFSTSWVRVITLSLVFGVLYHSFNGVRIILIDFWKAGVFYQRRMFYIVMGATLLGFVPMAWFILAPCVVYNGALCK